MRDILQYLKKNIQGNNEFVKEVIEEMLVGRSEIGEKKQRNIDIVLRSRFVNQS